MKNTETKSSRSLTRLVQRVRSFVIDLTASLMTLVGEIHYADPEHEIGWRDHLRWWLEGKLGRIFGWAWNGSGGKKLGSEWRAVTRHFIRTSAAWGHLSSFSNERWRNDSGPKYQLTSATARMARFIAFVALLAQPGVCC